MVGQEASGVDTEPRWIACFGLVVGALLWSGEASAYRAQKVSCSEACRSL